MTIHVTHGHIKQFAENSVNLPANHARQYRDEVGGLITKLDNHIKDNPDYHLKRMLISGSLAKRTSLRATSDVDVALYLKSDDAPKDMIEFIKWLEKELETFYSHINKNDIEAKDYSVSIKLNSVDVDVVPIYWQTKEWDGDLVSQRNGRLLRTNIPQHLEFMNKRHKSYPDDFRQIIRLVKHWVNQQKRANQNFRFKSFMVELIVAHLMDKSCLPLNNYPEALIKFFDYLIKSNLDEVISFNDFGHGSVQKQNKPINIFDPVNPKNNVADQYTEENRQLIIQQANLAADSIEYALTATTKDIAIRQWRKVFGNSFNI